jgi:hypothetical protein
MLLKPFKACRCTSSIIRFTRSSPSVIIRGLGTALGGRTQYMLWTECRNINNINTNDITYEILKDASALAIWY